MRAVVRPAVSEGSAEGRGQDVLLDRAARLLVEGSVVGRRRLSELSEQATLLAARQEALLERAVARGLRGDAAAREQARRYLRHVEAHERALAGLRAAVAAAEADELEATAALQPRLLGLLPPQLLGRVAAEARGGARLACRALRAAHDASATRLSCHPGIPDKRLTPQRLLGLPMLGKLSVDEPLATAQLRAVAAGGGGQLRSLRLTLEFPSSSVELAAALAQLTSLRGLCVTAKAAGREEDQPPPPGAACVPLAAALAPAVGSLTALTSLSIDAKPGAAAFAPALASLPMLRRLAVVDSDASALALLRPQQLGAALAGLNTLKLRSCGIRGNADVAALAAALGRLPRLEHLDIGSQGLENGDDNGNDFSGAKGKVLACAVAALADLRSLELSFCEGASFVCAGGLSSLTRLEVLGLGGNGLGNNGATAIAAALPQLAALCDLDLTDNGVAEKGALALAKALPRAPRLAVLRLEDNRLGRAGLVALAMAASQHASMKELRVTGGHVHAGAPSPELMAKARNVMMDDCACQLL